jgi:hypothetical protein
MIGMKMKKPRVAATRDNQQIKGKAAAGNTARCILDAWNTHHRLVVEFCFDLFAFTIRQDK